MPNQETFLIWWLTQNDIDAVLYGVGGRDELPAWVFEQLLKADQGRHGSLWIDKAHLQGLEFETVTDLQKRLEPFGTPRTILTDHCRRYCVGIVIPSKVLKYLKTLPGIVTGFDLKRV